MKFLKKFKAAPSTNTVVGIPFVGKKPDNTIFGIRKNDNTIIDSNKSAAIKIDVDGNIYADEYEDIQDATVLSLVKTAYNITADNIKKSDIVDDNFTATKGYIFLGNTNIQDVKGIGNLIKNCTALGDKDLKKGIFKGCTGIKKIDVSDWDISKCTTLARAFDQAFISNLLSITGLEKWDTSNVTSFFCLFLYMTQYYDGTGEPLYPISIDLSNWNTSNVTLTRSMFLMNRAVLSVGDLSKWDMSKVTDAAKMFGQCFLLKSVGDLSNWNLENNTNLDSFAEGCFNMLTFGDLSNWNISNVSNLGYAFNLCHNLRYIGDLRNWNTSKVTTTYAMFNMNYNLRSIGDIGSWDMSKNTNASYMFNNCLQLEYIGDLSNWCMPNVTTTLWMFSFCEKLKNIGDLRDLDLSNATNISYMFIGCRNLLGVGDIKNWDVSKVTSAEGVFGECYSFKELDLSNWNLASCTDEQLLLLCNVTGSTNRRDGDLTTLRLGKGFFAGSTTIYWFNERTCVNWSHDSIIESLYTNQVGRDTSKVKTIKLGNNLAKLSEQEIANITALGFTLTE